MAEGSGTTNWNLITGIFFAIAVIAGVAVGMLYGFLYGFCTFIIITGLFLGVSFYIRDESRSTGGPSTSDGAIMGSIILCGLGACGAIHSALDNVTITAVCIIAVMVLAAAVMMVRNRRYL